MLRHITNSLSRTLIRSSHRNSNSGTNKKLFDLISLMAKDFDMESHKKDDEVDVDRYYRRNKRQQKTFHESANVYFQVICPGTSGYPGSLFLYTDHKRFLFNCGEGTQRLCIEHCISRSLTQLEHVFLTRKSWDTMGGLGGMCLSIRGSGSPDVTVHGPKGAKEIYDMTESFITLKNFDVFSKVISEDAEPYQDSNLRIEYVRLSTDNNDDISSSSNNNNSEDIKWDNEYLSYDKDGNLITDYVRETIPTTSSNPKMDTTVIAYVLRFKGKRGKLNVEKCLEFGVTPGPTLGKLKNGEDVTLEDGTIVKSSDVSSPDSPEATYLILDLPSKRYLNSLQTCPVLATDLKDDTKLAGIFHFTQKTVLTSAEYSEWMNSFKATVKHHMINDMNVGGYGTLGSTTFTEKLHLLNDSCFRPLHSDVFLRPTTTTDNQDFKKNWISHKISDKIVVRGHGPEIETTLQPSIRQEVRQEFEALPEFAKHVAEIREKNLVNTKSDYLFPRVTFLGTGSSIPSKYRAPSAILLELRPDEYMILDCGEGTLIQLMRQFGREKTISILRNLKCVYISHLHADHHMGLIGLVRERDRVVTDPTPLYVAAPTKLASFLNRYHAVFEPVLTNLLQIKNEHLLPPHPTDPKFLETLGLSFFQTCRAFHCQSSFCLSLVTSEGFSLTYTGDTRPTPQLIDLMKRGSDSPDLLIHEATMEHYLLEDAIKKRHSTFTEAIDGGRVSNAKNTILTHFSQRYSKFPLFDEIQGHPTVGYAFDHMTVNPSNFGSTHHMMNVLRTVFAEDYELMVVRREVYYYKVKKGEPGSDLEEEEEELMKRKMTMQHSNKKYKRLKIE